MSNQNDKLKQLKTSSMDRRLSIAKASLLAGTRWAASNATTIFSSEVEKDKKRKKAMKQQADYLVSEIGKLKTVMLHRPGKELENLAPDILHRMLIDDIPYLKIAQEEHDAFAHVLRQQGIKVLYLEDLLAESLTDEKVRRAFLDQLLDESSTET